jgi:molybdate transport system permease protein
MLGLSAEEWSALALSFKVAAWCTALGIVPAIGLGWLLARRDFFGKPLVDALIHLPLVLPPVVPGFLLLMVFGHQGVIGGWLFEHTGISFAFNWKGAVLASLVMGFPLMVQSIRLSIELVDRRLEEAARTLGASQWSAFLTVTLPLALPGILVGALLGFSRSLGEFGATITFVGNIADETRTLPLAIYSVMQQPDGESMALRLIGISVLIALSALLISHVISQQMKKRLGYRSYDT